MRGVLKHRKSQKSLSGGDDYLGTISTRILQFIYREEPEDRQRGRSSG